MKPSVVFERTRKAGETETDAMQALSLSKPNRWTALWVHCALAYDHRNGNAEGTIDVWFAEDKWFANGHLWGFPDERAEIHMKAMHNGLGFTYTPVRWLP